jgi:hypothetical protein
MLVFAPTDANSLSGEWRNIAWGFKSIDQQKYL